MAPTTIAQQVLTQRLGVPVQLRIETKLRSSNRTQVYRCSVETEQTHAPTTVIVKQATQPYGTMFAGAADGNVWQEWAGLQLLNETASDPPLIPHIYGGDAATGLIILEDLGDQPNLRDILAGNNSAHAEEALVRFFATLGTLHARTYGCSTHFHHIRASLGEYDPTLDWYWQRIARTPQLFRDLVEHTGVLTSQSVKEELTLLVDTLRSPGPLFTFIHGDPTPANGLFVDSVPRLIDFEYGTYSYALLDGVQARVPFPTGPFVNRIPPHIVQRAEAAFRAELARGCAAAADDTLFNQGLVTASAYWTITFLSWLPFAELMQADQQWGIATVRQRVLYFTNVAAQTSEEFGYLEALGKTFRAITTKLHHLWPEVEQLPFYPAFRTVD